MGIIELLKDKGAYHGALRWLIESRTIFQVNEDGARVPISTDSDEVRSADIVADKDMEGSGNADSKAW